VVQLLPLCVLLQKQTYSQIVALVCTSRQGCFCCLSSWLTRKRCGSCACPSVRQPGGLERGAYETLCRAVQALESQPGDLERAPQLSGRVRLHDAPLVGGEPLALHFSLPRGYPGKADPVLQVAPHVPCQLKQKRV